MMKHLMRKSYCAAVLFVAFVGLGGIQIAKAQSAQPCKAQDLVTASKSISQEAPVVLKANQRIVLKPGFKATNGAKFKATIAPCTIADRAVMKEVPVAGQLGLHPNPANEAVFIGVPFESGKTYGISVYDANGKLLIQQEETAETNQQFKLPLDRLNDGLHIIQVITPEGKSISEKLLIQR